MGRLANLAGLMKRIDRFFGTSGFRGPVLTLLSGSGIVMAIAYLAQGVITRMYTPAEIGISHYFVYIIGIIGAFASLRYEDALMLPRDDEDAAVVVWLSLMVLGSMAALTAVLTVWRHEIADFLQKPEIGPYLVLVPIALLSVRIGKVAEFWLIRKRAFRHITSGHIIVPATIVGTRIGVGAPPVYANESGLIGGFIAGNLVGTIYLSALVTRRYLNLMWRACRWDRIQAAAVRYRRFAFFSTPATVVGQTITRLPAFLIPVFILQHEAELGYFTHAVAAIGYPLSYIARSVGHVFFVTAAEAQLKGNLTQISSSVHRNLIMVALFPLLALMLGGPDFFEVWMGSGWDQAGIYAQYVGAWLVLGAVVSPLTRIFDVTENQRVDFSMSLLLLGAITLAAILGGRTGRIETMLIAVGVTGAAVRFAQLLVLMRLARVPAREIARPYWDFFLLSLPPLALVALARLWNDPWVTTLALIVSGVAYLGLAVWKEKLLR